MLVLSRQEGESILLRFIHPHTGIAEEIGVTVSDIKPGRCKVGVAARSCISVHRVVNAKPDCPLCGGTGINERYSEGSLVCFCSTVVERKSK